MGRALYRSLPSGRQPPRSCVLASARAADGHGQRSRAGADECDHLGHEGTIVALRGDRVEPLAKRAGPEEHRLVGLPEPVDVGLAGAPSSHADDVEPDEIGERPLHEPERDHVGANPAHADHHRSLADAHELAHRRLAAEGHDVADRHVTAQDHVIVEGHVAADLAVMADMGADHQEAAIAHLGDAAVILGSGIHGDAFANIATGTDHQPGRTAAILDRLRRRAERCERIDHGARADRGVTGNMNMRHQPAAVADRDMRADDAIGADRHVMPDRRASLNAGGWIDCRHHATMAPTTTSATSSPATLASPRNHHMFRFRAVFRTWYSIVSPGTTGLRNLALSMVRR